MSAPALLLTLKFLVGDFQKFKISLFSRRFFKLFIEVSKFVPKPAINPLIFYNFFIKMWRFGVNIGQKVAIFNKNCGGAKSGDLANNYLATVGILSFSIEFLPRRGKKRFERYQKKIVNEYHFPLKIFRLFQISTLSRPTLLRSWCVFRVT